MPVKYADFEPQQRFRYTAKDMGMGDKSVTEMEDYAKAMTEGGVPADQARSLALMVFASRIPSVEQPRYRNLP